MKKVFLLAALFVASMSMMAEEPQSAMNQVIWHNGRVMYASPIPTVDSITFAADIESSDTLHLILPRTIIVHDTVIKEVVKEVHDTLYKIIISAPHAIPGIFSVSATKQVMFSQGNLQYTQSTATWAFAENQYDMIGTANVDNSALADKIDLFGWSGSTATAKWGINTSIDDNDYSGDFVDWGQNIGGGNTWRTLTNEEWNYLRETRANASNLMGVARIQISDELYANGLILLPDSWTCPDGVTFTPGFSSKYSMQAYADYQTFTLEQWLKLEAAGAVFLPASGGRYGSSIYAARLSGYYWSSTPDDSDSAYYLYFGSDEAGWYYDNRYYGNAVRLVQDL